MDSTIRVKEITLSAVIHRATGVEEDLGIVARYSLEDSENKETQK